MAKRKNEAGFEDLMEAQQQETIDTAQASVDISSAVNDRMKAAREAKSQVKAPVNGHKPKGADMAYVIIGETSAPPSKGILGIRRTRGQCRKQWDAVRDMAVQMYETVYVVKGKRIEVNSL